MLVMSQTKRFNGMNFETKAIRSRKKNDKAADLAAIATAMTAIGGQKA